MNSVDLPRGLLDALERTVERELKEEQDPDKTYTALVRTNQNDNSVCVLLYQAQD